MDSIIQLFTTDSIAHTVLVFGLVIALGLIFGSINFYRIKLGVAGVLFAGIIFGHFHITVNNEVLEFAREFGLILFVYSIGMQVGPGFLSAFKSDGLILNSMAAFVVLFGAFITICLHYFVSIPLPIAVGLFSGATTNTPSLAAAQQALKEIPNVTAEITKMPGLGYAVAYPFGIVGILITMGLVRFFFRINPKDAAEQFARQQHKNVIPLERWNIEIQNQNLSGVKIRNIPGLSSSSVTISRIMQAGNVHVALPDMKIAVGDVILAVGPKEKLRELEMIAGTRTEIDLREIKSNVTAQRIVITKKEMVGKTIEELDVRNRYGVTITRISRNDVEMIASAEVKLNMADTLIVVGEEKAIAQLASDLGNSPSHLDHPLIIPIFIGISLGVILGSWSFRIPGIPAPVKLGLAGGPLIVAMLLSSIGRIGNLVWYIPASANFMLREIGITLFLACVGLRSGDSFIQTLVEGNGFYWMACATLITLLPLLVIALVATVRYKMNYLTLCGLLAGSMTDPPALAFANQMTQSNAQSVAYANVYPLVMLLRVVSAQVLVIFFFK